jgi:two-component system phosphate regulon sensor histidine kinase PhoR
LRRTLPSFLVLVICLALWQVWLSWQLRQQDRDLAAQRSRERVEQVADLALAQLTGALADWDLRVREIVTWPPQGTGKSRLPEIATVILFTADSVQAYPKPLLFVPEFSSSPAGVPDAFEPAEQIEFREQRYDLAIAALRPLTQRQATRAEALLRTARLKRKLGDTPGALECYDRLSQETALSPSGVPYALLAAGARCAIVAGMGDSRQTVADAARLRAALRDGRWPLRNETFQYYWAETNRLLNSHEEPPRDLAEISQLASTLYERWRTEMHTMGTFSGRQIQPDSSLLLWNAGPSHLTAFFLPADWLATAMKLPANVNDIQWKVSGSAPVNGPETYVVRSLSDARLAGKLVFWSRTGDSRGERNLALWLGAIALMLLLVLTGAYAIHRAVNRELHVAQLQSDFVAAVSHEFRSPLTTLRTLTEMLSQDRLSGEDRRRQSYVFLERETRRLQRLVEDLLDFGRMESDRRQYRLALYDVFALVRTAVTNFREDALASGFQVELNLVEQPATVQADEEAVVRALRNLLENAVKYSPECRTIWVEGSVHEDHAAVSVRDRGMGLDPDEHREIFHKFVRGSAAKKAGIKGTGIGLSMVRQIVEAMGGQIQLESATGIGSTFTLLLPLVREKERSG